MMIGSRIAEIMSELGITQAELARRVGVAQPTIFKVIHNSKRGSSYLHRIARELGTTPAYLTGETDDPFSDVPDDTLTSDERDAVEMLRGLTPKDRSAVLQLLRTLSTAALTPTVQTPRLDYRPGPEA